MKPIFSGIGDGRHTILVLGLESSDHPLQAWMERALELVRDHGGQYDLAAAARSMEPESLENRRGPAGAWRDAFIRMPYFRDSAVGLGLIMDTFETAITWDLFESSYQSVKQEVQDAILRTTGQEAIISCRVTHAYPDGAAPYFTIAAMGSRKGDVASALAAWREIKLAANAAVVGHGGTATHHHAIGRDHRSGYATEVPGLFRLMLAGAKAIADPTGILNPGVLYDAHNRPLGQTGILAN